MGNVHSVPPVADLSNEMIDQQHVDAATDRLPVAVLVLDERLRALSANRGWEELTGLSAHDSRGMLWWQHVDSRDRAQLQDALATPLVSGLGRAEHRLIGPLGPRWTRWSWQGGDGRTYVCATDVDEDHRREQELLRRATHDPLTDLANRTELSSVLQRALDRAAGAGTRLAVVYLDLDGFKAVNDSVGHRAGDDVLVTVAEAVVGAIRPFDLAGRLGGDEFAVVCPGLSSQEEAHELAVRICAAIDVATAASGIPVTATAGVAVSKPGEREAESVLARADRAMYWSKREPGRRDAEQAVDVAVRPAADMGGEELNGVLVPVLFRIGLSLHAAAEAGDQRTAALLGEAIEDLDDVISSLRRAALTDLRRSLQAPSLEDARRELRDVVARAERAAERAWAGTPGATGQDEVDRLVQGCRVLRSAERMFDPRTIG